MGEEFGEFLDLPKFPSHAFAGLTAVVGDAKSAQPRGVGGDKVVLGAVVVIDGGCGCAGGDFNGETGGAVGAAFELGGLHRCEQVRIEKKIGRAHV